MRQIDEQVERSRMEQRLPENRIIDYFIFIVCAVIIMVLLYIFRDQLIYYITLIRFGYLVVIMILVAPTIWTILDKVGYDIKSYIIDIDPPSLEVTPSRQKHKKAQFITSGKPSQVYYKDEIVPRGLLDIVAGLDLKEFYTVYEKAIVENKQLRNYMHLLVKSTIYEFEGSAFEFKIEDISEVIRKIASITAEVSKNVINGYAEKNASTNAIGLLEKNV